MVYNVLFNFAAVVLGGLITWRVSKTYYVKAGFELREEAEKLRKRIDMVLKSLEVAGLVTLKRDSDGQVLDFAISLAASAHASARVEATLTDSPTSDTKSDPGALTR